MSLFFSCLLRQHFGEQPTASQLYVEPSDLSITVTTMPSNKKIRARAKKAERRASTACTTACTHYILPDRSEMNAYLLANDAVNDLVKNYKEIAEKEMDEGIMSTVGIYAAIINIKNKYYASLSNNEVMTQALLQLLLAKGTKSAAWIEADPSRSSSQIVYKGSCTLLAGAFLFFKNMDKNEKLEESVGSTASATELATLVLDLCESPREIVRFFHKRNCCDCLGKLYEEMKKTTPRSARCQQCREVKDFKQIFNCSKCMAVQYCSRDCQVSHWAHHKENCKKLKKLRL